MKLLLCVIIFSICFEAVAEKIVAVRLKKSIKSISVVGKSVTCCSKKITHKALLSDDFSIKYKRIDGLSYWQVYSKDADITKMYNTKRLFITGPDIEINNLKSPRYIELYAKKNSFDVIAHLELEEYLKGVLPSEMPASWPIEALKAQVIASRSYTLAMLKQRSKLHYNLESTVSDQVFNLNKISQFDLKTKKRVYKAIKDTEGLVLLNQKKNIHKSYYHADCGGQTEEPGQVWQFNAKNGTAKDPYCPSQRNSRWSAIFSHKKINSVMKKKFGFNESDVFKNLLVLNKSPSGRVKNIKIQFKNKEKVISAQQMREALGFSKMKSTLFEFKNSKNGLHIKGKGNGHGVGLCQWGARHWAKKGKSYREILNHYYPQAIIKQL